MRKDDWESHQPVCDTVITVYESSSSKKGSGIAEDDKVCLRAAVYYTKMGAYAEVAIKGFEELRQVIFFEITSYPTQLCNGLVSTLKTHYVPRMYSR